MCMSVTERWTKIVKKIYGLFCMLGSKPENNVSESNTSDHLLNCDLHLGF